MEVLFIIIASTISRVLFVISLKLTLFGVVLVGYREAIVLLDLNDLEFYLFYSI